MTIEKLKLFHFPASRSARARWALLETVGNGFDIEVLQLMQGEHYAPDFEARNPNRAVPVLEVTFSDGSVHNMIESTAMVLWLVDAYPEKQLAPATDALPERADYLQTMQFAGSSMDMMLWQIRIHESILPDDQADANTSIRYRDKFTQEVEPQLKARLSSHDHICGDRFSGADILMGHNVFWAHAYKMCQDPLFERYLSRLAERPAYIEAFSDLKR